MFEVNCRKETFEVPQAPMHSVGTVDIPSPHM